MYGLAPRFGNMPYSVFPSNWFRAVKVVGFVTGMK